MTDIIIQNISLKKYKEHTDTSIFTKVIQISDTDNFL